jgi:two-component system NarL family sensor kinase
MSKRTSFFFLFVLLLQTSFARQPMDSLLSLTEKLIKQADYAEAVKINNELLKLAEAGKDCFYEPMAVFKTGELYSLLKNDETAIKYFHIAMQKAADCKNDTVYWLCNRYLGGMYFGRPEKDSAFYYLQKAYLLVKDSKKYSLIASATGMLANTMWDRFKNMQEAEKYILVSLQNAKLSNDYQALGYANLRYGGFLFKQNKCLESLPYYKEANRIFVENKDTEGMLWSQKSLVLSYIICGEKNKTYSEYSKFIKLQDSLFKVETAEKAARYRELYETEKKEKENALKDLQLKEEARRRKTLTIGFISGIILLASIFLLLYNRYKLKKKNETEKRLAEEQLLRFKSVIDAEEKERERIARELHDGVGHLLSSAKLNVSAIENVSDENTDLVNHSMKIIDEALEETRTISHNLMPSALQELGFAAAIKQLVRKINAAGKIKVELNNEELIPQIEKTKATALYRIIQEVLNNMLKHSQADKIEIDFSNDQNKQVLQITDNGKGFDATTIKDSSGIGWKNIFSRAEMISGNMQVNSVIGKGTTVTVETPL